MATAGMHSEVELSLNTTKAKRSAEKAAGELNRIIGGVGQKQVNFNINSRSFTQPLGRITGSANEFTKSLEASNARVIAFGASVGIINGISDAFKNLVAETVRFEKTLADVNVVLDASNSSLQRFGQGLFDVAKNTSQSFGVAAEAALEFSRQGLSMEEVLKRTNDALTLTRLTGLKAAEAVSGLTAAVNAFSSVGLTTTQVIDKLAAVDVKFAVSSEDLINALERTGAVAIDAGVELDSLIGLVTSLQQTTARGGAVIGNGLKTIFTRIQRPKSLAQIEELDIAVRNLSGAILPADKILINLAKSFDTLTSSQKSNVVQLSAGIFQANVFRAALRDLGKTQSIQAKATEVSAGAAGEAAFKNEKLNKTIAALASQSGSAIEELAGVLGELMVKPEIGGFLELFKDGIQGITDMLGGGEETGSTFAKGLVAGVGNILTGPAAIAFGAVFIKLFANIAKFAQGSLKDVLNIVERKDKIKKIEESILETLSKNKDVQESLNRLDGDREAQGKFILKVIEAQTNGMREQAALAKQLARPLLDAGVKTDLTVGGDGPVDLDGDGVMDSFGAAGGVLPSSARSERKTAARGGYSAGAVDSMAIAGVGKVVYNRAETVKQFPGMKQPAIMPPRKSRAGAAYQDAFSQKHGFDPYASGGYVPNFATLNGSTLNLSPGQMQLYASPRMVKGGDPLKAAMHELVSSGRPVSMSATTEELLKGGEGGSHTKKIKALIRFIAEQEGGPSLFERDFKVSELPYRGNKGPDEAETAVAKAVNKERGLKGKHKFINTGKKPGSPGDKSFPVDLIGLGMDPLEVKSGEWSQPNLLLKSLRLYSDDDLMSFAERQYGASPEMLTEARREKLGKSSRLLIKKGLLDPDASLEDQHKAAIKYGIAGGFVPNFEELNIDEYKDLIDKLANLVDDGEPLNAKKIERLSGDLIGKTISDNTVKKQILGDPIQKDLGSRKETVQGEVFKKLKAYYAGQPENNLQKVRNSVGHFSIPTPLYKGAASKINPGNVSWKFRDDKNLDHNLAQIQAVSGGLALKPTATQPGASYIGTRITSNAAGLAIKGWGGPAKVMGGLSRNQYKAMAKIYTPQLNGVDLDQMELSKYGINTGDDFEQFIKSTRTPLAGALAAFRAPLDFLGPDGEAKISPYGSSGNFPWESITGKILRSDIGNKASNFKSLKNYRGAFSGRNLGAINLFQSASQGLIPNFAGDTMLYRGTSPKYQKAVPDRPNAPQFLFNKLLNAQTKIDFLSAVEELGTQHAKGKYSGSYNTDLKPATLEQMRGGEGLGEGEVQHAGYVYKRPIKGQEERTMPSGFVSKSKNRSVADRFSRALEFKHQGSHDQQGQIHEDKIPNNRILNKEALEKIVDRVGLPRVQKGFKRMMKNGTLKDLYMDLDQWRPKTEKGEQRRGWDETHNYRSIGHSGEGMTFNEEEVVQIWSKHSPYYGAGKGLVPNFADNRNRQQKISDVLGDPSNAGINFKGGKPRSIKSKNMFQKMWLESYLKTGLEGDYQMLMKMGYDPDELLSLRSFASKGGEVDILGKGFVPNFANPLKEAIAREAGAGIPKSQIRVEQSGQLRGPGNPMGLAVTNKRDEPLGVGQGIRRARSMGMDPRRHGAASGMIPNFADDDGFKIPEALLKVLNEAIEAASKALKEKIPEATDLASKAIQELPGAMQGIKPGGSTNEEKLSGLKDALKKEGEKAGADQNPELIKKLEKATSAQEGLIKAIEAQKSAPGAMGKTITKNSKDAEKVIKAARKLEIEEIKRVALARKGEQKAITGTIEELQNLQDSLHQSEETTKEESKERSGGLQKLFYMQSAISMVNGFLEQFSEGARGATKNFLDLATAASNVSAAYIQQKEVVNQGMKMFGVGDEEKGFSLGGGNEKARGQARATEARIRGENLQARGGKGLGSIGKFGAMGGKLVRNFGRFIPVLGQLYTAFTAADEVVKFITKTFDDLIPGLEAGEGILDLFASSTSRASKKLEKLGKTAESLQSALEGLKSQTENNEKIQELEALGSKRTMKEEVQLQDLKLKGFDLEIKAQKGLTALTDKNIVGSKIAENFAKNLAAGTMTTEEYTKALRQLLVQQKTSMVEFGAINQFASLLESKDIDNNFFTPGSDDKQTVKRAAIATGLTLGASYASNLAGSEGMDVNERIAILEKNIATFESTKSELRISPGMTSTIGGALNNVRGNITKFTRQ